MSHAAITPEHLDLQNIQSPAKELQMIHQTTIKPAEGFELKQTKLAVHNIGKHFFGRIVPYYRFCVEGVDDKREVLQSVDIPVARFEEAVERMTQAFNSDEKHTGEDFSSWGARKGYPFFTEMLEDLLVVGPDDLPHLLNVEVDNQTLSKSGLHLI